MKQNGAKSEDKLDKLRLQIWKRNVWKYLQTATLEQLQALRNEVDRRITELER